MKARPPRPRATSELYIGAGDLHVAAKTADEFDEQRRGQNPPVDGGCPDGRLRLTLRLTAPYKAT